MTDDELAAWLVQGLRDPDVVIGPACFHADGSRLEERYFIVCSWQRRRGYYAVSLVVPAVGAEEQRQRFILTLLGQRRPLVVHAFDDDLEAVRRCLLLWPCGRLRRLVRAVEAERRQRTH